MLHGRIEATLDAAMQRLVTPPPLPWLAAVAMFYGQLRPQPLPRHVLEDCADLALQAEVQDVGEWVGDGAVWGSRHDEVSLLGAVKALGKVVDRP